MKTLVIHPSDETTTFLKLIYKDIDCTVINERVSNKILKESIKSHDRIIMLGHGTEKGLFNSDYNTIIDGSYVYLLREKECVCVWCNADVFFEKHKLKGFYTGMIISDYYEANMFCVNATNDEIEYSNRIFAEIVAKHLSTDYKKMADNVKAEYSSDTNGVIQFNHKNIYYAE